MVSAKHCGWVGHWAFEELSVLRLVVHEPYFVQHDASSMPAALQALKTPLIGMVAVQETALLKLDEHFAALQC